MFGRYPTREVYPSGEVREDIYGTKLDDMQYLENDKYPIVILKIEEYWSPRFDSFWPIKSPFSEYWNGRTNVYYKKKGEPEGKVKLIEGKEIRLKHDRKDDQYQSALWDFHQVSIDQLSENELYISWVDKKGNKKNPMVIKLG